MAKEFELIQTTGNALQLHLSSESNFYSWSCVKLGGIFQCSTKQFIFRDVIVLAGPRVNIIWTKLCPSKEL